MRGHIRSAGEKNKWHLVIYLGRDETGKKKYKWHTFRGSKKEAELRLAEMVIDYEEMGFTGASNIAVQEYMKKWLEEAIKPFRRPKTYTIYEQSVRCHINPILGAIPLKKLNSMHIQEFLRKLSESDLSVESIRCYYRTLRAGLGQAVKWKLIKENPAKDVILPEAKETESKGKKVLSFEDAAKLIQTAKEKTSNHLFFLVAIMTGMRSGEILALRWEDLYLDEESPYLIVRRNLEKGGKNPSFGPPKTKKSNRLVLLPKFVAEEFKLHKKKQENYKKKVGSAYQDKTGLVFTTSNGTPYLHSSVYRQLQRVTKHAGIARVSIHELRHTHVTLLTALDVPPELIAARVGHNEQMAKEIYFHHSKEIQKIAVNKIEGAMSDLIEI